MRGNIVVPDDIDSVTEFTPLTASMCEELPKDRYLKARAKDGLPIAQALAGLIYEVDWCIAALTGKRIGPLDSKPLPQRGLEKSVQKRCFRLDAILKKFRSPKSLKQFVALPDEAYDGMIALSAATLLDSAVCRHQIYQCHIRRAFYTFDRDSGFMFPGGSQHYIKLYGSSVLSTLLPVLQVGGSR